jgi:hypothetical protein
VVRDSNATIRSLSLEFRKFHGLPGNVKRGGFITG